MNQNILQSAQSWRSSKTGTCICQSLPATAVDEAKPIWKQLQQQTVGGHQQQQLPGRRVKFRKEDGRGTNRGRNHSKLCLSMYLLSLLSVQPWWGGLPPVYWLKIQSHLCSCPRCWWWLRNAIEIFPSRSLWQKIFFHLLTRSENLSTANNF